MNLAARWWWECYRIQAEKKNLANSSRVACPCVFPFALSELLWDRHYSLKLQARWLGDVPSVAGHCGCCGVTPRVPFRTRRSSCPESCWLMLLSLIVLNLRKTLHPSLCCLPPVSAYSMTGSRRAQSLVHPGSMWDVLEGPSGLQSSQGTRWDLCGNIALSCFPCRVCPPSTLAGAVSARILQGPLRRNISVSVCFLGNSAQDRWPWVWFRLPCLK